MDKRAAPSTLRGNQKFIERRLSVSYANTNKLPIYIIEDYNIRKLVKESFALYTFTNVMIERIHSASALVVNILTQNSHTLAGENFEKLEAFKIKLSKVFKKTYNNIQVGILPIKNIHTDVHAIARSIVHTIESKNGTNYMSLIRNIADQVHKNVGLLGISIRIAGRINGGTIASNQRVTVGIIKMQTLKMDITSAVYHAKTKTGMMGVQVILARTVEDRTMDEYTAPAPYVKKYEKYDRNNTGKDGKPFNKFNKDRNGDKFNKGPRKPFINKNTNTTRSN